MSTAFLYRHLFHHSLFSGLGCNFFCSQGVFGWDFNFFKINACSYIGTKLYSFTIVYIKSFEEENFCSLSLINMQGKLSRLRTLCFANPETIHTHGSSVYGVLELEESRFTHALCRLWQKKQESSKLAVLSCWLLLWLYYLLLIQRTRSGEPRLIFSEVPNMKQMVKHSRLQKFSPSNDLTYMVF